MQKIHRIKNKRLIILLNSTIIIIKVKIIMHHNEIIKHNEYNNSYAKKCAYSLMSDDNEFNIAEKEKEE